LVISATPPEHICAHQRNHTGLLPWSHNSATYRLWVTHNSYRIQRAYKTQYTRAWYTSTGGNQKELSDAVANGVFPVFATTRRHFFFSGRVVSPASTQATRVFHTAIAGEPGYIHFVGARAISPWRFDQSEKASIIDSCWRHHSQFRFTPAVGSAHEGRIAARRTFPRLSHPLETKNCCCGSVKGQPPTSTSYQAFCK